MELGCNYLTVHEKIRDKYDLKLRLNISIIIIYEVSTYFIFHF